MNIYDLWSKALKGTEIVRPRVHGLPTDQAADVPYILLSASSINTGDTVVRKGAVRVERPALLLPPTSPQLEGFDFSEGFGQESFFNFLLVRGITLPSMKYNNNTNSLDIFEGDLRKAIQHYGESLQRAENVTTGLLIGPEDCWQFSLLVYMCSQVARNAQADINQLLKEFREKN